MAGETLTVRMLMTAQAEQARRELTLTAQAARELKGVAPEVTAGWSGVKSVLTATGTAAHTLQGQVAGLNRETRTQAQQLVATARETAIYRTEMEALRAQFNPIFAASRQYEAVLREIADAERLGAISTREAAAAREQAAQSMAPMNPMRAAGGANVMQVGNLAAQFNDIGVMAAYQNPLQLALQQGTQINQVFASMGGHAAGIRAIGAAFAQIVNPMSLATIGIIAFGAMGIQWLLSLREEVVSVEDALAGLKEATEALDQASRLNSPRGFDDLERQYGQVTGAIRTMVAAQESLARLNAQGRLDDVNASIADRAGTRWYDIGISDDASSVLTLRRNLELSRSDAETLRGEIAQLGQMQEPEQLADQYAHLGTMIRTVIAELGSTPERRAFFGELLEAEAITRRLVALENNRGQWDTSRGTAMLAELESEAAIRQAINRYGEDSVQVIHMRIDAERRGFEATLATLEITDDLKVRLIAAWDAAKGVAATDMASGIARARAEAQAMADEIMRAVGAAQSLMAQGQTGLEDARIRAQYTDPVDQAYQLARAQMRRVQAPIRQSPDMDAITRQGLDAEVETYAAAAAETARLTEAQRELMRSRREGAGATDRSRAAVDNLITGLNDELAILRESDPVRQEMLRNRSALAAATAEERAEVEDLIRTRNRETQALADTQRAMSEVQDMGRDVVRGIVDDLRAGASAGDILTNVLDRILDRLVDMSSTRLTDMLFGPTSGSGGGGGLLTSFMNALFGIKMNAMGDVVGAPTLFAYGDQPGKLGVMGEAGPEAIMPLSHAGGTGVGAVLDGREVTLGLTRLSSGKLGVALPQNMSAAPFATGGSFGFVPSPPARSAGGAAGSSAQPAVIQLQPVLINNTSRQVDLEVEETTDARGQRQQRYVISDAVSTGLSTPGGKAQGTMKQVYGASPPARRRS